MSETRKCEKSVMLSRLVIFMPAAVRPVEPAELQASGSCLSADVPRATRSHHKGEHM